MTPTRIPFIDLRPGEDAEDVRRAVDRVIASGWFVLGPELEQFEAEFAAACGAAHAIGVATGTDAIALVLRAAGVGRGDEVIVPAITAGYTALAVIEAGAVPVIADVDESTLNLDPAACAAAITSRTRAIVPVHLYGQAADLDALRAVASRHSLLIVEDCCQAHLATHRGVPVGTTTVGGAFSFYPTKNLGALGDAGAVITNDAALAARVRRLRNGGQAERYRHVEAGVNSRLDELQAAVLRTRLPRLAAWTARRRILAGLYRERLHGRITILPERDPGHVYHLFVVRSGSRDVLRAKLLDAGIETLVHYPVPLHEQPALGRSDASACPTATRAARELLSLPMRPNLTDGEIGRIADTMLRILDS